MQEQWKPIAGYEGIYEVSNLGRVRTAAGLLRKPSMNGNYLSLTLTKDGKNRAFRVHKLVATAFVPNPDSLPIINHKDENCLNNSADNLEWCSSKYNNTYGNARKKWHDTVYNNLIQISYKGEIKRVGEWAKELQCTVGTVYKHYRRSQEHFENWVRARLK